MTLRSCIIWLTLGVCLPASARTYYVSSSFGDDSRNGLCEQTCWRTLARVNNEAFRAGDRILLRRGDRWSETLRPPSSGTEFQPIVFGAYGSGAAPILSGGEANIDHNGQSYIVYENLDLRDAQEGLRIYVQDRAIAGITFQNNRVESKAKQPKGMVSAGVYVNTLRGSIESIRVLDNIFVPYPQGLEHWGVYFVAGVRHFEIRNNRFTPAGEDAITVWHASDGLIEGNVGGGNGENTVDIKDSTGVAVRWNHGEGDKEYCIVAHGVEGRAENIAIEGNRCSKSGQGAVLSAGIALLRTRGCRVLYNRVEHSYGAAILVRDEEEKAGNQIAHNVLVGTGHGISPMVLQQATGSQVYGNQVIRESQPTSSSQAANTF